MFLIHLVFLLSLTTQQELPRDTVITLERTECFGTCPSYKLSISANGKVVFIGQRFVKKTGKFESRITQDQLKQLVSEFERINYFSLKDDYGWTVTYQPSEDCPEWWTDHPTAYTSITINGKTKKVGHYDGCKGTDTVKKLAELENRIDEIVGTKQWIE
ncbi:MAG TPA: DUF6438 domain-containing protein [Nitrososphaera sp.]|jgi:hypothetical protein|nr:DUF6438 domain-containing protein [Nitrososphaera sp.]